MKDKHEESTRACWPSLVLDNFLRDDRNPYELIPCISNICWF